MIRVAVDGRVIQDRYHGIGRHAFELARAMAAVPATELIVLHGRARDERLPIAGLLGLPNVAAVPFDARVASLAEKVAWGAVLRRLDADVLFEPYHLAAPWRSPLPVAVMVHDCIFETFPAMAGGPLMRRPYRLATRLALSRASAILTVSKASRDALHACYGILLPDDQVVPNGVDPRFASHGTKSFVARVRAAYGLSRPYILHVGVRRPHKNHATLLRAFAQVRDAGEEVDLVLVGEPDARFADPVPALIDRLGLQSDVRTIATVPEDLLAALYQGASVFAFPSIVEGFGMPVLEAMAARVPVVASDAPAVVEAAGGAALLVPARDAGAWGRALLAVLRQPSLADHLRWRGTAVADAHTWDRAARSVRAVLSRVAGVEDRGDEERIAG